MYRASWWGAGLALLFALFLSDGLLRTPIQRTDSLELILAAQSSPSAMASFTSALAKRAYMRPIFRAQNKLLFDLGEKSSLQWVFRGFHAGLLIVCLLLFARAARVETARDFFTFAVALAVLLGLHTFRGAVGEAYPVNHYLNVTVVCLLSLVLAQSAGGVWVDALAALGFVYAVFILETGLLVGVIAASAWMVGWRGISIRGLTVLAALTIAYAYLRFIHSVGMPGLAERSTGFLFSTLDPPELIRRFGGWPLPLYVYNAATSALSVLLSEPRAGRFAALDAWGNGAMQPRMMLALATSLLTTLAIGIAALRAWRLRVLDDNARYIGVFAAVLAGNAAISFAYTKDEIMLPAGVFYALAAYGAWRGLVAAPRMPGRGLSAACAVLLVAVSVGWTIRAAGLPYHQRSQAFKNRNDWADLAVTLRSTAHVEGASSSEHLIRQLGDAALASPAPNPRFEPRWLKLILEE